ncbi:MAG: methylated-DNA--[protein]-cysteine S-methyltransferase [Deferrisomatales bacterium]
MRERAEIDSPVGRLELEAVEGALVGVRFRPEEPLPAPTGGVLAEAARQLALYFAGRLERFRVPTRLPEGATPFQRRVWKALEEIPAGQTRTYGELARQLGTGARAVGGACRRNPLPVLVPCHRVVARTGLGGYSGQWETGLAQRVKALLLAHEARVWGRRCAG